MLSEFVSKFVDKNKMSLYTAASVTQMCIQQMLKAHTKYPLNAMKLVVHSTPIQMTV